MCPHQDVSSVPLNKEDAVAFETGAPHIPMPNGTSNIDQNGEDGSTLPPAAKPVHQQKKKNPYGPRYSDFLSNTSNWSVSDLFGREGDDEWG
jgi:hypothetical protein